MSFCSKCGSELSSKIIESKKQLACSNQNCDYVFWNNPTPVVAALVELNGEFLLAHNNSWPEGTFSMITGFVDALELPEDAVVREIKEELGLESSTMNFLGHYIFKEANQLIIAYHIIAKGEVCLNEELSDYKLVSKESLEVYNFEPFYITQEVVNDFVTAKN
ncbi:NUDIX domain-containing protein [Fibrobacterales bacterium]|nr:NUDIX domain-containing protein [Fibrobacterales bacterium]